MTTPDGETCQIRFEIGYDLRRPRGGRMLNQKGPMLDIGPCGEQEARDAIHGLFMDYATWFIDAQFGPGATAE